MKLASSYPFLAVTRSRIECPGVPAELLNEAFWLFAEAWGPSDRPTLSDIRRVFGMRLEVDEQLASQLAIRVDALAQTLGREAQLLDRLQSSMAGRWIAIAIAASADVYRVEFAGGDWYHIFGTAPFATLSVRMETIARKRSGLQHIKDKRG